MAFVFNFYSLVGANVLFKHHITYTHITDKNTIFTLAAKIYQ